MSITKRLVCSQIRKKILDKSKDGTLKVVSNGDATKAAPKKRGRWDQTVEEAVPAKKKADGQSAWDKEDVSRGTICEPHEGRVTALRDHWKIVQTVSLCTCDFSVHLKRFCHLLLIKFYNRELFTFALYEKYFPCFKRNPRKISKEYTFFVKNESNQQL